MFRASDVRWRRNSRCDKLTRGQRRGITKAGICGGITLVTTTADTLPDDVESLRALVLAARAERDRLADQIGRLRHIIRELRSFGKDRDLLDEVWHRLTDAALLERDDLGESIEQMSRGEGRVLGPIRPQDAGSR